MSDYHQLCACERGSYDPDRHNSCYICFRERIAAYESCVWCGRWHSPKYATCFTCRAHGRDEAARHLRFDIIIRDNAECGHCGDTSDVQIDHVMPCSAGGNARPWNLQVLCAECNRLKGSTWYVGGAYWRRRVNLMTWYFTSGWRMLDSEERQALREEAALEPTHFVCSRASFDFENTDHHWADGLADEYCLMPSLVIV